MANYAITNKLEPKSKLLAPASRAKVEEEAAGASDGPLALEGGGGEGGESVSVVQDPAEGDAREPRGEKEGE